jgi:hypothetical protein
MADRGATAAFLAELLLSTNSPCFLVSAYFDDGTISMTDAWRAVVWNSKTHTAQGHFLGFDGLTETAELQASNLTLTLSAVDQTWISTALTKQYIDRRLTIHKAFLDYTQSVITSPVLVFDGSMNDMTVNDSPDGTCTVAVSAVNAWGDFEATPGRHTNSAEQQVFFPGDKFFEFVGQLNREIRWGAA